MRRLTVCVVALAVSGFGLSMAQVANAAPKKSPEEQFAKMDANGDKKLSKEEFVGKKTDDMKTKAEKRFGKLDKDGDGFVSLDEFKAPPKKKA